MEEDRGLAPVAHGEGIVARIPQSGLAVGGRLVAVLERVQRRRAPLRKEIHGILREAGRSQRTRTTTEGHGAAGGHR
jgi:hypothetical protein